MSNARLARLGRHGTATVTADASPAPATLRCPEDRPPEWAKKGAAFGVNSECYVPGGSAALRAELLLNAPREHAQGVNGSEVTRARPTCAAHQRTGKLQESPIGHST